MGEGDGNRARLMQRRVRVWLGVGGVVVLALALLAYAAVRQRPGVTAARLRSAIEANARYLAHIELRGDDAWIATQGASKLGPRFKTWAETLTVNPIVAADAQRDPLASRTGGGTEGHLWQLRWLPEPAAAPLAPPDVDHVPPVSTALTEEDLFAILRIMAYAVVCPRLGDAERERWLDELRTEAHSYLLTHQLLSLMLGRNQGCLDDAVVEPLRQEMATRLWLEHAADSSGVHDLSIERLAVLCYAQVCNWVRPEWVEQVLAEQDPSGSWGERNPGVHERVVARPEHTAALAFYVLAAVWADRFSAEPAPLPPSAR